MLKVDFYFERQCVLAHRQVRYEFGNRIEESVLVIKDFQSEDLNREFNCSVRNERGFDTCRAELQEEGEECQEVNTATSCCSL